MSREKDKSRRLKAMALVRRQEEIDKSLKKKAATVKEKKSMYEATHDPKKEPEKEKEKEKEKDKPGQPGKGGQQPGQGGKGQGQGEEEEKKYVEVAGGAPHEVKEGEEGEGGQSGGGAGGSKGGGSTEKDKEGH